MEIVVNRDEFKEQVKLYYQIRESTVEEFSNEELMLLDGFGELIDQIDRGLQRDPQNQAIVLINHP